MKSEKDFSIKPSGFFRQKLYFGICPENFRSVKNNHPAFHIQYQIRGIWKFVLFYDFFSNNSSKKIIFPFSLRQRRVFPPPEYILFPIDFFHYISLW